MPPESTSGPDASRAHAVSAPESVRERIDRARDTIGTRQPGDYQLVPSRHAARYESVAPELARLLRASAVQEAAQRYERKDAAAQAAQRTFDDISRRARAAVLVAGLAAALVLVAGGMAGLLSAPASRFLLATSASLGVIAGGVASWLIRRSATAVCSRSG